MTYYVDTSAAVKLVVHEIGSDSMRAWAVDHQDHAASSDLTRTELIRAVRRVAPDRAAAARAVLDSLILITMRTAVFERAALLEPSVLRSLDSLHLAAALELGDDLSGFVTYDDRQAEAATSLGMTIVSPGL